MYSHSLRHKPCKHSFSIALSEPGLWMAERGLAEAGGALAWYGGIPLPPLLYLRVPAHDVTSETNLRTQPVCGGKVHSLIPKY